MILSRHLVVTECVINVLMRVGAGGKSIGLLMLCNCNKT